MRCPLLLKGAALIVHVPETLHVNSTCWCLLTQVIFFNMPTYEFGQTKVAVTLFNVHKMFGFNKTATEI